MVTTYGMALVLVTLAQQPAEPVLERLDPPRRAAVIMALLALVLIGLLLVTFIMLGAHWVRRLARHKPGAGGHHAKDSAAENQRLRESLKSMLPEVKTNDTVHFGRSSKETKMDM
jgi:predicted PurR-regulated permease PerM